MAVRKLRAQVGVLRLADIGPPVALSLREDLGADFRPRELRTVQVHRLVDALLAWTQALGTASRTASRKT